MSKSDKTDDVASRSELESSEVDVAEAARVLIVSRSYVREPVANGKLPGARVAENGNVCINRAQLMAYRERMRTKMKAGLDQMTEASDQFGRWGDELESIPTRSKPDKK